MLDFNNVKLTLQCEVHYDLVKRRSVRFTVKPSKAPQSSDNNVDLNAKICASKVSSFPLKRIK